MIQLTPNALENGYMRIAFEINHFLLKGYLVFGVQNILSAIVPCLHYQIYGKYMLFSTVQIFKKLKNYILLCRRISKGVRFLLLSSKRGFNKFPMRKASF